MITPVVFTRDIGSYQVADNSVSGAACTCDTDAVGITADEIAKSAEFFSFGTNDLTQMGCGFSRDDAGKFLIDYVNLGVYENDPFQSLDIKGIGKLVSIAVTLGKGARKDLKVGICGEHGGDPASVKFCHQTGLTYVSCSPFRVPIARLSAAHAVLQEKDVKAGSRPKGKQKSSWCNGAIWRTDRYKPNHISERTWSEYFGYISGRYR